MFSRVPATTICEAIEQGIDAGLGKSRSLRARIIVDYIRAFILDKTFSKDIELERSFRIFFLRIFGGKL